MKQKDLDTKTLLIFGDFGVLTNTPFKDGGPLALLEGRKEALTWLQEDRARRGIAPVRCAVAGNKGGVAWGMQTEEQATEEVAWTAEQIGSDLYAVCFACETTKAGYERYADPELLKRRKPDVGMIEELIERAGVPRAAVLVVGNYADDYRAAQRAQVQGEHSGRFFADVEMAMKSSDVPAQVEADGLFGWDWEE